MDFTIVKKGYDPNEVNAHISKIEEELSGFKSKESAISKSLISAEIAAQNIIGKAEDEAKKLVEDAHEEINEELNSIEKMISSEKKALDEFCSEYDIIVKNYFTGSAVDITAPLREKIGLLENIIKELRMGKSEEPEGGALGDNPEAIESMDIDSYNI